MLRKMNLQWFLVPVLVIVVGVAAYVTIPAFEDLVNGMVSKVRGDEHVQLKNTSEEGPAQLVKDVLILTPEAYKGLNPQPQEAVVATKPLSLPAQFATIDYDYDRLFQIRSRFPGEVFEIPPPKWMRDLNGGSLVEPVLRPLRVGDKVEQNELLAVISSQQLGQAKSLLIDAICSLAMSKKQYELKDKAFQEGALSLISMMTADRTVQSDMLAKVSALRSLWMWKLTAEDIEEVEKEAKELQKRLLDTKGDNKEIKSAEVKKLAEKWARVEIRVPTFKMDPRDPSKADKNVRLTLVEKNTNIGDMLDPTNTPAPIFRLADMSRLQVKVQPQEEYYPVLADQLNREKLFWSIQFEAYKFDDPINPPIEQVYPSIDPSLRTCIVTGYLKNPDQSPPPGDPNYNGKANYKYLVGQFATATIFVEPEKNTVEIPTNALNDSEGESLVFVQDPKDKLKVTLRRVAVSQRFRDVTHVRSVLNDRDKQVSERDVASKTGKHPIEELHAGDIVLTRGVVQLKALYDNLSAKNRMESLQPPQ